LECGRAKARAYHEAAKKKDAANRPKCIHCHEAVISRPKGLCWNCSLDPAIRNLYPADSKFSPTSRDDMTMEELDALIAERYPTMPNNDELPEEPRQLEPRIRVVKVSAGRRFKSQYLFW
jgi:hypothetical protein